MNKVISESKKVAKLQPKLEGIFNEVNTFAYNYKSLEKENQSYMKEINKLKENKKLENEKNNLLYRLNQLYEMIKKYLRKVLKKGDEYTKQETVVVVKDCYDNRDFSMSDVVGISRGTTKQDELFEYVNAPDYLKEKIREYDEKNDLGLSR
jgi:hypothetical protein